MQIPKGPGSVGARSPEEHVCRAGEEGLRVQAAHRVGKRQVMKQCACEAHAHTL